MKVVVAKRVLETADIVVLDLVRSNGEDLPTFDAGSHIDVSIPGGLTRQYSLCNSPAETHRYQIGVLNDAQSRGGSRAVHAQFSEGTEVSISEPKNHFPLTEDADHSILLAGGIGVTPILCMAERLSALYAPFEMHYCTRSQDNMAFQSRLDEAPLAARVFKHFDDGAPEQKLNIERTLSDAQSGTHIYVCGPQGFMDAVLSTARNLGWPEAQLHFEFFNAEVAVEEGDTAFEVELAQQGRIIRVERDETVIEALDRAGVEVEVSCEQGVCGTCQTRVLDGIPDHRDMYMTDDEHLANDSFMPCCSRAKSPRLVLDL